MKTEYIEIGKMDFKFHLVLGLGFFYESSIFHYDEHKCTKWKSYYFLCFKLNTTQNYRKFN